MFRKLEYNKIILLTFGLFDCRILKIIDQRVELYCLKMKRTLARLVAYDQLKPINFSNMHINASNDIAKVSLSNMNSNLSITKDAPEVESMKSNICPIIKMELVDIKEVAPESHNYTEERENSQEKTSERVSIIK